MPRTEITGEHVATRPIAAVGRDAFEALVARQYTGLRLLILRRTGDSDVAADLLSEAICTAWEKWQAGLIKRPDLLAGYVFKVAVNLLRNFRRSVGDRADRRARPEVLAELPDGTDATDAWLEKKIALRVKSILRHMPTARDREVLTRVYLLQDHKETICSDLKLDADQFDRVLHRARGRLKALLESHGLKRSDFFMLFIA